MTWLCYTIGPCLVLDEKFRPSEDLPFVIPLKRFPSPGETFIWNNKRWRVRDLDFEFKKDELGIFKTVEVVVNHTNEDDWKECSECGGVILCSDSCSTKLHREGLGPLPSQMVPSKKRSGTLDAPLRKVVSREAKAEILECGHTVYYSEFKYIDTTVKSRRCLVCCVTCPPRKYMSRR